MGEQIRQQCTSAAERDALARLDGAWKDLDAINPEMGYALVCSMMQRLQLQPTLGSVVMPRNKFAVEKPTLSGSTLYHPIPTPKKEITRPKRTQSTASEGMSRIEDEGSDEEVEEVPGPKTQGDQLAAVLYTRWLEGLRKRWEGKAY